MQAYKLNATIDESGHLIIDEPLNIAPGKVEVIILQPVPSLENFTESQPDKPKRQIKIKALQGWFEKTQPTPSDFDPDQARWEALKEKHNL
ncbi:hypothetical protein [Nostoc sp. LPT]|uniref:hypothetical protein n=1 Tax=Nostoc sp. LPT TaxID=2815387 RepID=UPI001DF4E59B|nr:hypothetical protein [Nostoc sp. LPT]MBN4005670.1 hypothetical protein [Nostoc sp. LPT]